jgi:hypothetical protein
MSTIKEFLKNSIALGAGAVLAPNTMVAIPAKNDKGTA